MFHVKWAVEWTFTAKKLMLGMMNVYFELKLDAFRRQLNQRILSKFKIR